MCLQEDLIAKLEQEGAASSSRLGRPTSPAADKLTEQVQADVSNHPLLTRYILHHTAVLPCLICTQGQKSQNYLQAAAGAR